MTYQSDLPDQKRLWIVRFMPDPNTAPIRKGVHAKSREDVRALVYQVHPQAIILSVGELTEADVEAGEGEPEVALQ